MDLEKIVEYIGLAIGFLGILTILYGVVIAVIDFIRVHLTKKSRKFDRGHELDLARVHFLRHLIFGLDFFIAKDLIDTLYIFSYQELIQLGVLVSIRIILGVFLEREIQNVKK